ncbi:SusC/RagA family TonB-linked outer membrane protein [Paludibacter sp.]
MLILLDGFEQSKDVLDQIGIREIESVSILKDAASTALYGQRAGNGILSIETKRGFIGKPSVKIEATTGLYNMLDKPHFYDSYNYMGFYNEALQNDGLPIRFSEETRLLYKNSNSELYPNTFWYNEALNQYAPLSKVGMSIRGGNDNIKYFVFANFSNQRDIFKIDKSESSPTHNHNRINFRTNFDIKLFEFTKVKVDIGGYLQDDNTFPSTYSTLNIFTALQQNPPYIMGQYADGVYGGDASYKQNPLAMLNGSGYTQNHHRYYTANFELIQNLDKVLQGLSFHGKINIMNWSLYSDTWNKNYATEYRQDGTVLKFGFDDALVYTTNTTQIRNMGSELFLDYYRKWSRSEISGILGSRISQEIKTGSNSTRSHLDFFGKVSYIYQYKYFADLVCAYNGSQNFAPGKRFGFFPALAAGWVISNEDWFSNHTLKKLKFRASSGLTGSDYVPSNPVDYRFMYLQRYYWHTGYNLGNDYGNIGGIVQAMPPYLNAKWENSFKTNIGFDLGITEHFNLSLDAFIDDRTDILVSRDGNIPSLIGIELPLVNQGRVISKGIEIATNYSFNAGDFTFGINGYFNYYKSKIIEMNEIPQAYPYLNRTGHAPGQFFGMESIGFFKDQDDIDNSPKQLFSEVRPGDIKYKNQNDDNVIDEFDMVAIGKSNVPEILYAFAPSIEFKGIKITALFEGVANRTVFASSSQFWAFNGQANITSNAVKGRWTLENTDNVTLPRLTTIDNKNNYRTNDIWLKNGAFLKLRNVELSYNFPQRWTQPLKISQLTIYVRGNNLFSLDHIENGDPEDMSIMPAYSLKNIGFKLTF